MTDKEEKDHKFNISLETESWANTFFGLMLGIAVIFVLFDGEPSIAESTRVWVGKWAGTIPQDYVWMPEKEGEV